MTTVMLSTCLLAPQVTNSQCRIETVSSQSNRVQSNRVQSNIRQGWDLNRKLRNRGLQFLKGQNRGFHGLNGLHNTDENDAENTVSNSVRDKTDVGYTKENRIIHGVMITRIHTLDRDRYYFYLALNRVYTLYELYGTPYMGH